VRGVCRLPTLRSRLVTSINAFPQRLWNGTRSTHWRPDKVICVNFVNRVINPDFWECERAFNRRLHDPLGGTLSWKPWARQTRCRKWPCAVVSSVFVFNRSQLTGLLLIGSSRTIRYFELSCYTVERTLRFLHGAVSTCLDMLSTTTHPLRQPRHV
jgi:hypothetical protein